MSGSLAIVIPAYKATYFRETLESIATQTDKRFTLYIGDDCSPHDLKSIVDEYSERINIVYHRFEENLGGRDLVAHWERCVALTQDEEYIWLFSDDDVMDIKCVESFNTLPLHLKDNSLIHFNVRRINEFDGEIKELSKFPAKMSAGEFLEAKLRGKIISFVVEFIFSRKLYHKVNGFQNFDLAWGSDFITWLKMAAESGIGIISIPDDNNLVNWRFSNENISPNKSHSIVIRKLTSLIENASFIKEQLNRVPEKYKPLKKELRWLRFPLGEIYRNRRLLSLSDIYKLCVDYSSKVGYSAFVFMFFLALITNKTVSRTFRF